LLAASIFRYFTDDVDHRNHPHPADVHTRLLSRAPGTQLPVLFEDAAAGSSGCIQCHPLKDYHYDTLPQHCIPTLHRQPRILLAGGRRRAPLVPEMGHRARQKQPALLRWFAGGLTNTCYNALDRHVDEGRGNELAVIFDSPVTGTKERYTYREFRDIVAQFAGALQSRGVRKGDRVIIYMPMIPEAVVAMLSLCKDRCHTLGGIWWIRIP